MSIVERIKNICLTPNTEWPVIANEPSSTGSLIAGYVAPLIAPAMPAVNLAQLGRRQRSRTSFWISLQIRADCPYSLA